MDYREFIDSLEKGKCPQQLKPCLQALWYDAAGDWNTAHEIVQRMDNAGAARIHAYLHREEGDEWNSRYWHRQAGTSFPEGMSLEQEWQYLVKQYVD
ncbi:MAG: hypothetical protein HKO86_07170 [Gammaproteobacteria bacterium]|nr:hypothetical protein [Gammaproteobacteria bacterium]